MTGERLTILVIDDDDTIRDLIVDVLEDEGYRTLCATNGRQALEILDGATPAVIVVDSLMPMMNGSEFVRRYRETYPKGVPIMMLSGQSEGRRDTADLIIDHHLMKPFDLQEFLDAVAALCDRGPAA